MDSLISSDVEHSISSAEISNIVKIGKEIGFQIENDNLILEVVINGENAEIEYSQ